MNRSPNPQDDPDPALVERMHRHLLGNTEPAEVEVLERQLLDSREARAQFLQAVRMDAALYETAQRPEVVASAPAEKVISFPWRPLLAAAAVLILAGLAWWRPGTTAKPAEVELATLIDARDCTWAAGTRVAVEGRLTAGILNLTSGVALIEFDGGARLALQGPATLEVQGIKKARLLRGNVTVRCEEGADGFSLLTPTSTVIDLGTEFGVAVAADGGTAVEVLDGAVEVAEAADKSGPSTRVLTAGETLKLHPDGTDQLTAGIGKGWIRDYTSPAERAARSKPPMLLAHDGFLSAGVPLREYTGGSGWQGAWVRASKDWHGSFYFAPLAPLSKRSAEVGEALVVGTGVELRRTLAAPIDPSHPQRLYVGFSTHRLYPNVRDAAGRLGDVTLLLRASQNPGTFIGAGLSGFNRWVTSEQAGWERSEGAVSGAGPYFIVARIDIRPKRGNTVAMIGFDSATAVPVQEPSKWELVTHRRMVSIKEPLDTVALRVGAQSAFKFGEISIGNSWRAVTNPAAVAVASTD